MKQNSRMRNSMMNLISGFTYRIIIMLTAFVVRTIFVKCLDDDYLGLNGLYSNILSMLSLAELGFGNAMVFSMYEPLAKRDYDKLRQLMDLYRKVYKIIGSVILALGLCLVPLLDYLIKNKPDVPGLTFYYILFLLNTVVSYWFFAYRNAILQADQKGFVISNYNSVFNLIKSGLQIVLLLLFHSYTFYLLSQILCTVLENICLAAKVKNIYPIFHKDNNLQLPKEETNKIFRDVKALMLSKISHVILNSTDNLIISAFVGINWVGLLSNFCMVTEAITGILTQITGAIQASLGNYFVHEEREAGYKLFRRIEFLNFWLYGFSMIAFIVLLNPFIIVWLGEKYTLPQVTIVAIAVNFFVAGFMNTLWTFRSTLGLFVQGQYRPVIVAILNVVLSILLSFRFGITGVLAATFLSRACVNLWYDPWLLHKNGFGRSVKQFYMVYACRLLLISVVSYAMWYFANRVVFYNGVTLFRFAGMVVLTGIIPNIVMLMLFYKTDEFQYFWNLLNNKILHIGNKRKI